MNKLKSTFSLRHKDPEKRSEVFIKRLSSQKEIHPIESTPKIELEDLSEEESNTYLDWWRDLDPFGIGKADNKAIFNFVSGSNLPDPILEEILALFQDEKDGLNRQEFFAMLRLIAHAQNGRKISSDIVYLGAPLPKFQTQAIDALINSASQSPDMPSWMIPLPSSKVTQSSQLPNTTVYPHHTRSRSVPSANLLIPPIESSRRSRRYGNASLNQDSLQKIIDTGKSLLLTQEFKPKFSDEDDNPFESTNDVVYPPQPLPNAKLNIDNIPPPPVPPQSTKPAFPKYTRRLQ